MAFLALIPIGAAIGSAAGAGATFLGVSAVTWGVTIASTVGAVVDAEFTFPLIFGRGAPGANGPRTTELHPQTGSEGAPMNFSIGPENRMAGTCIWMQNIVEHPHKVGSSGGLFGKGGGGGGQSYTYTWTGAIAIQEAPPGGIAGVVRIWADSKLIYDNPNQAAGTWFDTTKIQGLTIYAGTPTQTPDPVIESIVGAGNTPAFRGTAYAVFENMQLADWGNRVPNFTFLVASHHNMTVGGAIQLLLLRGGLTSGQIDVSEVTPVCFRGYTWSGPQVTQNLLVPMMNAYGLRTVESAGVLKFFQRGNEDGIIVPAGDLGARDGTQSQTVPPFPITDSSGMGIPTRVAVTYIEPTTDYQRGAQAVYRQRATQELSIQIDVPFVLTAPDAQAIAKRTLWTAWAERQSVDVYLPPSYIQMQETDVIQVTVGGNTYQARFLEVERGANYVVHAKCVIQEPLTAIADGLADESPIGPIERDPVDVVVNQIMDIPALRTQDTAFPMYYAALAAQDASQVWSGAQLYMAASEDSIFQLVSNIPSPASMGVSMTVLDVGQSSYFDYTQTLRVQLYDGTLSSSTEQGVLNGENIAFMDGEIFGFVTATLVSPQVYDLTGLLRGRRDTWDVAQNVPHDIGSVFVLLDPGSVTTIQYNTSLINSTRSFRGVPVGGDPADALSSVQELTCKNMTPFTPANLSGYGPGPGQEGDITITWNPCTRDIVQLLTGGSGITPLDPEKYQITVYGDGTQVLQVTTTDRTYTLTQTVYTGLGLSLSGNTISFSVNHLSSSGFLQSKPANYVFDPTQNPS